MRAFIAIELPTEIKDALSKIEDKLKTRLSGINWINPLNLHLTLKFLGEISPEQLDETKEITAEITKITPGFRIKLNTLGVFPNLHAARIIWIGAHQPPWELKQLAERLETRLAKSSIPEERRPFCAHITIGRIKSQPILIDLKKAMERVEKEISGVNWEFDCGGITLFESVLGPQGATYAALKKDSFRIT